MAYTGPNIVIELYDIQAKLDDCSSRYMQNTTGNAIQQIYTHPCTTHPKLQGHT
jgi:hypothetical protein